MDDALHYDLTELLHASGAKLRYYGIARTVMEVAREFLAGAAGNRPVRFVVHSPGHGRFFEVRPRILANGGEGTFDAGLGALARPIRLRESHSTSNAARDAVLGAVRPLMALVNRRRWAREAPGDMRAVDLDGACLVSLGRPKLMADALASLARSGQRPALHALLHDTIPLHDGELFGEREFSANFQHDNGVVIRAARTILTNSRCTAAELHAFSEAGALPPLPPVVVTPLCHEMRASDEPVGNPPPDGPYILSVGIQRGRKNLECVMEALLRLHETGRPVPRYVIAGAMRKRVADYVASARFAAVAGRVHFAVNPNEAELAALYRGALALVIASRLEGWGLPLGEALWLGTPAIAARAAALDEVGGDLALWFDPDEPEALAAHVHRLMTDEPWREALEVRIRAAKGGLRRWSDVARDIAAAVA